MSLMRTTQTLMTIHIDGDPLMLQPLINGRFSVFCMGKRSGIPILIKDEQLEAKGMPRSTRDLHSALSSWMHWARCNGVRFDVSANLGNSAAFSDWRSMRKVTDSGRGDHV